MLNADLDLTRLDHLIENVQRASPDERSLVIEHLKSARTYRFGGMPAEYALSLQLASEASESITDPVLREETKEKIQSLRGNKA